MKFLTSALLVLMLAGCVKEMEVVKIDNRVSNGISVIILNTSRLDNQLRRALLPEVLMCLPLLASILLQISQPLRM